MDDVAILEALFDLARAADMEVRVTGAGASPAADLPPISSGACRVRGRVWVVLAGGDPVESQIRVLAGALKSHAGALLAERHLPPALRERIFPEGEEESDSA